jgi:hypothetical protein
VQVAISRPFRCKANLVDKCPLIGYKHNHAVFPRLLFDNSPKRAANFRFRSQQANGTGARRAANWHKIFPRRCSK